MNLIICCTPLQVLIAEKIIEQYPNEKFIGVMFDAFSNQKFQYYAERLKNKCSKLHYIHYIHGNFALFKSSLQLLLRFKFRRFSRVFIASIDKYQIHMLLTHIKFNHLYTFDDGTANIEKHSLYYQDNKKIQLSFKMKIFEFFVGNKFDLARVKKTAEKHYSIYKNRPNIIDNVEYIDLFDKTLFTSNSDNPPIKILLGQPIYPSDQENIELAKYVIEKFNIDCYLPHPRELYHIDNINYIHTPLIFEDFYLEKIKEQPIEIYTYFSSAVLNIINDHNAKHIHILKLNNIPNPAWTACYALFDEFSLDIIEIKDITK